MDSPGSMPELADSGKGNFDNRKPVNLGRFFVVPYPGFLLRDKRDYHVQSPMPRGVRDGCNLQPVNVVFFSSLSVALKL